MSHPQIALPSASELQRSACRAGDMTPGANWTALWSIPAKGLDVFSTSGSV